MAKSYDELEAEWRAAIEHEIDVAARFFAQQDMGKLRRFQEMLAHEDVAGTLMALSVAEDSYKVALLRLAMIGFDLAYLRSGLPLEDEGDAT